MYPLTAYANAMVAIEALAGLMGLAIGSGLMSPVSPTPTRVLFSRVAVIVPLTGANLDVSQPTSANQILEAQMRVRLTRDEVIAEGELPRRVYDLAGAQPELYSHSLGRRCIRLTSTVPMEPRQKPSAAAETVLQLR